MRRIETEWQEFISSVLNGKTITKIQYQEMRKCFFYGFTRLLRIMTEESRDLSEEQIDLAIEELMIEANEFVRELKVEAEMMERKNGAENV